MTDIVEDDVDNYLEFVEKKYIENYMKCFKITSEKEAIEKLNKFNEIFAKRNIEKKHIIKFIDYACENKHVKVIEYIIKNHTQCDNCNILFSLMYNSEKYNKSALKSLEDSLFNIDIFIKLIKLTSVPIIQKIMESETKQYLEEEFRIALINTNNTKEYKKFISANFNAIKILLRALYAKFPKVVKYVSNKLYISDLDILLYENMIWKVFFTNFTPKLINNIMKITYYLDEFLSCNIFAELIQYKNKIYFLYDYIEPKHKIYKKLTSNSLFKDYNNDKKKFYNSLEKIINILPPELILLCTKYLTLYDILEE